MAFGDSECGRAEKKSQPALGRAPAAGGATTKLESEFCSDLHLPRRLAGCDLPEASAGYRRRWVGVIDAVEGVEGIKLDHESHAFS